MQRPSGKTGADIRARWHEDQSGEGRVRRLAEMQAWILFWGLQQGMEDVTWCPLAAM